MTKGYRVAFVNVKHKEEYQKALGFLNENNLARIIHIVDGLT